jgi:hypothetical protein
MRLSLFQETSGNPCATRAGRCQFDTYPHLSTDRSFSSMRGVISSQLTRMAILTALLPPGLADPGQGDGNAQLSLTA